MSAGALTVSVTGPAQYAAGVLRVAALHVGATAPPGAAPPGTAPTRHASHPARLPPGTPPTRHPPPGTASTGHAKARLDIPLPHATASIWTKRGPVRRSGRRVIHCWKPD